MYAGTVNPKQMLPIVEFNPNSSVAFRFPVAIYEEFYNSTCVELEELRDVNVLENFIAGMPPV